MKSLPTLMRVKQRELDALKRQQATLEKRRDDLLNAVDQLTDQLVQELKAAEGLQRHILYIKTLLCFSQCRARLWPVMYCS